MRHSCIYIIIIVTLAFIACRDRPHYQQKAVVKKNLTHFPNVTEVIKLGDTMRIEIERMGDSCLIKHYIDLQGSSGGDKFDDSYNVVCVYKKRIVDSTVFIKNKKIRIQATLSEKYETEFSKGTNYYVISHVGDTILYQHILDYIR